MPTVGDKVNPVPADLFRQEEVSLALNIADLSRLPQGVRAMLLAGKIDPKARPINVDRNRQDEAAVALSCPLAQAAGIADVIRDHDRKAGDSPTRTYLRRGRAWVKVPAAAVLTLVKEGKVVLNPEHFPEAQL